MNDIRNKEYGAIPMNTGPLPPEINTHDTISQGELNIIQSSSKLDTNEDFSMQKTLESLDNGIIVKIYAENHGYKNMGKVNRMKWKVFEKNSKDKKVGRQ